VRRRELLAALTASLTGSALGGCERKPPTREEVLRELVLQVVLADTGEVERSSHTLSEDVSRLESIGSTPALEQARASWRAALLAWKRAACFGLGPLVETNALVRAVFWPVRTAPVEQLLAGTSLLDDRLVTELGVDLKGVYCLEELLFPPEGSPSAASRRLDVPENGRRRTLATLLARSVADYAGRVRRGLGDGEPFAAALAADPQAGLSQVVERMIMTVEHVAAQRLARAADLEGNGMLKPALVEGALSGTSHEIALVELLAAERLYRGSRGRGLDALAAATAPAIRERVDGRFADAVGTLRAIAMPLERAAVSRRGALTAAAASGKALELALKVDLASALGVTISFASTDGD
jgi:predicted lipoprotein